MFQSMLNIFVLIHILFYWTIIFVNVKVILLTTLIIDSTLIESHLPATSLIVSPCIQIACREQHVIHYVQLKVLSVSQSHMADCGACD